MPPKGSGKPPPVGSCTADDVDERCWKCKDGRPFQCLTLKKKKLKRLREDSGAASVDTYKRPRTRSKLCLHVLARPILLLCTFNPTACVQVIPRAANALRGRRHQGTPLEARTTSRRVRTSCVTNQSKFPGEGVGCSQPQRSTRCPPEVPEFVSSR